MVGSYFGKETKLFVKGRRCRIPLEVQGRAALKLLALETASSLEDLRSPPSNRLERLSGDRAGQHSIRINDQWRICFRWEDGCAYDVEITDYH
jgi:toxin HigB-1